MPAFANGIMKLTSALVHVVVPREAQDQGGLLTGKDPTAIDIADPIRIWIVQLGVIMITTQLLSLLLSKLRQPRVIAEVLCGIFLGPTIMGRVPGFTKHIFPEQSRSYLDLTATIGLVFFLFLVGLEIDLRVIQRNARNSAIISIGAILLPLGIGFGMAVPIYNEFVDPASGPFTHFSLFVAVAYSITAFPVLCRILSELKLMDTTIGIVVLSAGVGNDIVGWTLLALSIALVNAGSGLTALYILLTAIAWALVILIPIKRIMLWIARKTGSTENGPTPLMMTISLMLMFASAFFTDIIGVHAIFGAFLAGLSIPHEGGLAIALTEKLEDLTSIVFLPLYFMYSGLSTDLGLLNDGKTWGYTILIISTAYFGKMVGGLFGAKAAGFTWRESATVGTLLSCKGLVELIVLNIGLSAGILSAKVFSMFVLEALVLTFFTTPMTLFFYPARERKLATATGGDFASAEAPEPKRRDSKGSINSIPFSDNKLRLTVVLDKAEHLPALFTITRFLQAPANASATSSAASSSSHQSAHSAFTPRVSVDALRIIELTERTSMLMKSAASGELVRTDQLLNMYRTFGDLHDLNVSPSLSIVSQERFAGSVADHAHRHLSDLIVLSWLAPGAPGQGLSSPTTAPTGGETAPVTPAAETSAYNPFDALFKSSGATPSSEIVTSNNNASFVRRVFGQSTVDVALYVDRSYLRSKGLLGAGRSGNKQHILLPFFGGPDDRLALAFVMQLCAHPGVSATIVRMIKIEASEVGQNAGDDTQRPPEAITTDSDGHGAFLAAQMQGAAAAGATSGTNDFSIRSTMFPDTVYPNATTQIRLESDTADNIAWARHSRPAMPTAAHDRVEFVQCSTPTPIHHLIDLMDKEYLDTRLIVAVGRARRLAVQSHQDELRELLGGHGHASGTGGGQSSEIRKTVGDVAAGVLAGSQSTAALIVLQAADESLSA